MKEREEWIDRLRGIGIVCVVLIHTGRIESELVIELIHSFLLPLFFFISGLLVKPSIADQPLNNCLKKLGRRIVVPYLAFSIISYLSWLFLFRYFKGQALSPVTGIIGILYGTNCGEFLRFNGALWFFPCFFVTHLIFYSIVKLFKKNNLAIFYSLAIISVLGYNLPAYFTKFSICLPWGFEIALTSVVFCGIGFLIRPHLAKIKNIRKYPLAVCQIISFLCWVSMATHNSKVDYYIGSYGNYWLFYGASIAGIFFWILIAQRIRFSPFLVRAGQNSLVIYSLHLLIIPLITGFLVHVLGIPRNSIDSGSLISIVYTIISITILIHLSLFLDKKFPELLGGTYKKGRI